MEIYTYQSRRVLVRGAFTDQGTYRRALGDSEPLSMFAYGIGCGNLDAPTHIPAGSMVAACYGAAFPTYTQRGS